MDMYKLVEKNKLAILKFLKTKNIVINNIDEILDKITVEIGQKKEYPYAKIDKKNPFKIIISEDIDEKDMYKWLNHEMLHVISNNTNTIDDTHVGGIIIEIKENNIWIGQYLNEAITEYINQLIINSKYSDYYDRYIEALEYIIDMIGKDVVIKAYFSNNLSLIVEELKKKSKKSDEMIMNFIESIDHLYDNETYKIEI